jgi:ceramide glucosyltransferase
MHWLSVGYWTLSALAIIAGALLTLQTYEHRRFVRSRLSASNAHHIVPPGRVALVTACKGADVDLEANLRPLFEQDYEEYELIFSVESHEDAACSTIQKLILAYPGRQVRLVVAGLSTVSGQKVHNLLAATERLPSDIRVVAFLDADARPPRDWLRLLTQRLNDHDAATGYRYFVPKRPSLANHLLASIDGAVLPIMFPGIHSKVWGGSWAIRRDAFDAIKLRDAWRGTISDDLVAARELAHQRQRLAVEPAAILPSPLDVTLGGMFEFVRRQFMVGRYYSPLLWCGALIWTCLAQGVFWGSLIATAVGLVTQAAWMWQPAFVTAAIYGLHVARAWLRREASRHFLPGAQEQLASARRFDIWCGPLAALAGCLAMLGSALGRRIVWRQIAYDMRIGGGIRKISFLSNPSLEEPVVRAEAARRKEAA